MFHTELYFKLCDYNFVIYDPFILAKNSLAILKIIFNDSKQKKIAKKYRKNSEEC